MGLSPIEWYGNRLKAQITSERLRVRERATLMRGLESSNICARANGSELSWLTDAEHEELEIKNCKNMIIFHEPELRAIHEGARATKLLTHKIIKKITAYGVFERSLGGLKRRIVLSDKGLAFLGLPARESP